MYQAAHRELTKTTTASRRRPRKGKAGQPRDAHGKTDSFVDENTLTVNIARLRRKLEAAGLSDYITTKKGLGYLIE